MAQAGTGILLGMTAVNQLVGRTTTLGANMAEVASTGESTLTSVPHKKETVGLVHCPVDVGVG